MKAIFKRPAWAMLTLFASGLTPAAHAAEETQYNVNDYYEVHQDGRIFVFDDARTYRTFLDTGETAFRLTRIGAGKKGETLVFGLTALDKGKSESEISAIGMHDGRITGADDSFYAEIVTPERIVVFEDGASLKLYRETGDLSLRQTEIGGGPAGQRIDYAISPKNKSKKADGMIERYKALRAPKAAE